MDTVKLAERKILESDYSLFARSVFKGFNKQNFLWNSHHEILSKSFQRVIDGKVNKLLICIPPRYSKTEMVKLFCAMGFARNPSSQFIYTSYSKKLAMKCSKEIKEIISCKYFKKYWPLNIKTDTKSKELWETEREGGFYATSFGGAITGFGAGKMVGFKNRYSDYSFNGALIIDDPIKIQDRFRKVVRDSCIDYYSSTLPSRFNSKKTPIVCIMQRVHIGDLAGYIISEEKEDWEIIELKALKDDGTALWEAKHNIEDLKKLAKINEMFSAQYQQQPILLGGNIIKTKFFKRYKELPCMSVRYITADTAIKEREKNDYTVFQCWGKHHETGCPYLIDQVRKKVDYVKLKPFIKDFWNKHNSHINYEPRKYGYLAALYVEDKSSGSQIIQETRAEGEIPTIDIQRNKSKIERVANILLPKLESGFVYIPEGVEWASDFFAECENFTGEKLTEEKVYIVEKDTNQHDDQIDAMIDGIEIAYQGYCDGVSKIIQGFNKRKRMKNRKRKR